MTNDEAQPTRPGGPDEVVATETAETAAVAATEEAVGDSSGEKHRGPVVLRRYSDVRAGHLPTSHPASRGAVAAVPIWWRGEVLGVNVAFAGTNRRFSTSEVDRLEVVFDLLGIVEKTGFFRVTIGDTLLLIIVESHGIS